MGWHCWHQPLEFSDQKFEDISTLQNGVNAKEGHIFQAPFGNFGIAKSSGPNTGVQGKRPESSVKVLELWNPKFCWETPFGIPRIWMTVDTHTVETHRFPAKSPINHSIVTVYHSESLAVGLRVRCEMLRGLRNTWQTQPAVYGHRWNLSALKEDGSVPLTHSGTPSHP